MLPSPLVSVSLLYASRCIVALSPVLPLTHIRARNLGFCLTPSVFAALLAFQQHILRCVQRNAVSCSLPDVSTSFSCILGALTDSRAVPPPSESSAAAGGAGAGAGARTGAGDGDGDARESYGGRGRGGDAAAQTLSIGPPLRNAFSALMSGARLASSLALRGGARGCKLRFLLLSHA